jgi:general secretion pathway protein G
MPENAPSPSGGRPGWGWCHTFRATGRTGVSGFTLIELVITLAIVAILASVAFPLTDLAVQRTREHELKRALRDIREGIDAYKQASDEGRIQKRVGESGYPRKLEDLVDGVEDLKSPKKERIYFMRRLPRDPLSNDRLVPAAESWGKRSYASPPDDPQQGDDIFDVFSLGAGVGINGRPYREW